MMWLYLLKKRSEVSSIIEIFFNEIKKSVFYFHSCASFAFEYIKKDVSIFCSKNEIIHQTSCSHTPQQNIEQNPDGIHPDNWR